MRVEPNDRSLAAGMNASSILNKQHGVLVVNPPYIMTAQRGSDAYFATAEPSAGPAGNQQPCP